VIGEGGRLAAIPRSGAPDTFGRRVASGCKGVILNERLATRADSKVAMTPGVLSPPPMSAA
jgi:hypothetical protein